MEMCDAEAEDRPILTSPSLSPNRESDKAYRLHKCAACFKQFKQKSSLVEHMEKAGHSSHEPRCGNCMKHCRCLDALREHLLGPLRKKECAREFQLRGCTLCLNMFDSEESLTKHHAFCCLTATAHCGPIVLPSSMNLPKRVQAPRDLLPNMAGRRAAVALDCEMVGGGQDGSLDLCARLCIVDENEDILLNTYVKPELLVTDYRFEVTGICPEDLAEAMPIAQARKAVEKVLYNGAKSSWGINQNSNLLVGHSLDHDLRCLGIDYPAHLQRDTAFYPLLIRTSNTSNKLCYLTRTYLGYNIQEGEAHDPYEDAIAAMRLYKRMRMLAHPHQESRKGGHSFLTKRRRELEAMNPDELLKLCQSHFHCWCLDA